MWAALKRVAPVLLFGALPMFVLAAGAYDVHHTGNLGNDFRFELYPEAKRVLQWANPYPASGSDLSSGRNPIFPIPAALLVAPLTVLSPAGAAGVDAALLLALLAATLWVLDVRDWRVYGVVALWAPAFAALQTGNLTIVLGFLVALAWRWRNRVWAPGLAIGAAIALKLFLWPLLVWLLAIRKGRAAAAGAAAGLVGLLLVLPFETVGAYLRLMNNLRGVFGPESYNVVGLLSLSNATSVHVGVAVGGLCRVCGSGPRLPPPIAPSRALRLPGALADRVDALFRAARGAARDPLAEARAGLVPPHRDGRLPRDRLAGQAVACPRGPRCARNGDRPRRMGAGSS